MAVTVAIVGYAYPIFTKRYQEDTGKIINSNQNGTIIDDFGKYLGANSNVNQNSNENLNGNENANANDNLAGDKNVTPKDCDSDCARFKSNEENLRYCQEVCGDIPSSKKNSEADCANLAGLEKDYCWRDLAVSKLNSAFCGKVTDKKLQSVCRNRVAEELLN